MPRLALYQPDIPQNCGTILRLGACLGVPIDIIEPCGFVLDDKRLRRAGMDYLDSSHWQRHASWQRFLAAKKGRLILLTTRASIPYYHCDFREDDVLLLGRESAGVPDEVHETVDLALRIPLQAQLRSINVAQAASMVIGEVLRQLDGFPKDPEEDLT